MKLESERTVGLDSLETVLVTDFMTTTDSVTDQLKQDKWFWYQMDFWTDRVASRGAST